MTGIDRRTFLKAMTDGCLTLAGTSLLSISGVFAAQPGGKKPNFVFVFADDWGWGDLGCYGHPHIKTPNLDKLARDGMLFTQFYVNGSVCSPSRAAIMTGHFPARHGIHRHLAGPQQCKKYGMPNWLDPKLHTVTKLLKDAGYTTGHFGKWHLSGGPRYGNHPDAPEPGSYGIDDYRVYRGNGPTWNVPDFKPRSTELIVDESTRFIEENKNSPFYVNVWLKDTHAILDPTEEQMKPYAGFGLQDDVGKKHKGTIQIYYAVAADADRHLGRLFEKIDELGLTGNTVVVFSSDNGPEVIYVKNASHSGVGSTGPFRGRKRSLYEGGIRMPFIVRWPGHTPAGKIDNTTVISGVDWLVTICSLAGVKLPDDLNPDGEDMSAALLGKPKQRTKPLMWEWRFAIKGHPINKSPMLAIRHGKWKLLMNPDRSRVELYDIPSDPMELNNLAAQYPSVAKKLSEQILKWQATLPKGPVDKMAGSNAYPWPKER